ncbi:unnamed protein product [Trichogramma brassicae]|uniref:Reverse transcriptase domain-containing protein n=1 Tax=Trichogramma brassicae TaxID=86971 RepID=A0A6H5HX80_9HYME|nr:unnamed protein product [Trichogramma brassicae]
MADLRRHQALVAETRTHLRVAQANLYSVRKNFELIERQTAALSLDVFSMCETWLTPDIADGDVAIPGYSLVRCDRGLLAPPGSRNKWVQGGGVACYIRESLKFKTLHAPKIITVGTPEFLAVELMLHGRPTLVVSVYSPEGIFPNNVLDFYDSICHKYQRAIIAGDFNINMLSQEYDPNHLREVTEACGLSLIPSGPTNHTANADTWIDLIFVDDATGVRGFQKSQVPFADTHDLLFFEYFFGEISVACKTITTRRFSNFNKDDFDRQLIEKLNSMPFPIDGAEQAESALNNFNSIIIDLLDIHAPLGTLQRRRLPAPWFTKTLRDRCRARDKLYALARRLGDVAMLARYREVRRVLRRDIKHAREQHLLADLSACTDDARRWSYLRGLGLVSVEHRSPLEFFSSQELSRHYSSINNAHPLCSLEELQNIIDTPSSELESQFEFEPVSPTQMLAALRSMGHGARGRSLDGVSFSYLKHSLEIVAPYLAEIFNAFIASNSYPMSWKRSTIVPLSKVARPASPSQTRPVANLPHMARACDILLTQQMSSYLESRDLLSPRQSGFRPGYSTQSALIKVTEDMRRAIEDEKVTVLVLFDFKCAFDTINHATLLGRLRELNFTTGALRLLHSYLSGRSQAVIVGDGVATEFVECTSGVPQGSSPAPVLFTAYIDTVVAALRHCTDTCMLFADDLQIYLSCEPADLNDTIGRLCEDAQAVLDWSRRCGLRLNAQKTQAIVVASDQRHMRMDIGACRPLVVDGVLCLSRRGFATWVLSSRASWLGLLTLIKYRRGSTGCFTD